MFAVGDAVVDVGVVVVLFVGDGTSGSAVGWGESEGSGFK